MTVSVSDRRVAAMPRRDALERGAGANQRRLGQIGADELEADRQTFIGETAGQRDRRTAGHVERAGVSLQFRYEFGLLAERAYGGERQRSKRVHRSEQEVDG